MSEASPSQDSSSLEETLNGSSPPPLETQTPPSPGSSSSPPTQDSNSSPPSPDSDSSPPSPNSNSSPPSLDSNFVPPSQDSNSSPPSPAPPSNSPPPSSNGSPPPPNSSPSPPPPQDDVSSPTTTPPPPPLKFTSPPPSNSPPSSPPSSNPVSPPPPNDQSPPPSNSPPSNNSPPPPSPPPLIVVLPPPNAIPVTPLPPNPLTPVIIPPVPETPVGSSQTPPLQGSPPNPTTPTESTPVKPSPSTPSEATAHVTPPSRQSASSSSSPASSRGSSNSSGSSGSGPIIGLALAGVVVALVAIFFVITRKKKRRMDALDYRPPPNFSVKSDGYYYRQENPVGNSARSDAYYVAQPQLSSAASGIMYGSNRGYGYHTGPPDPTGSKSWFTYEELMDITNGFARENLIGEGGFGYVYKGFLPDGRQVAVKQLKAGSGQGEREFRAEVEIISRVHHRHLVSLVGYCIAEYHRLLVYEFVPNNTLEHHLHAKGLPAMDWPKRVKLAIGSARGLAYLHEDCHPRIIHRDIKSANILLDDAFEAQVADFGLAKLSNDAHTHVSTRVMGTFGYMAPEYASSGKLTDRSDVFSFGVVLLELITGRKPVDPTQPLGDESLVEWARPLLVRALETGNCEELVDPRLENNFNKTEMFRMIEAAAACVRHSAPKRPRMVQVVRALDNDGDMLDLTNGVKFGQSQVFDSGQYSTDIQRFRRMAFGDDEYNSSEYGPSGEYERRSSAYSGEYHSRESSHRPPNPSRPGDHSSGEHQSSHDSETRAMNPNERSCGGGSYRNSGRKFP